MDDNEEILGTDNPSFGGSGAKAGGKLMGTVFRNIAEYEAFKELATGGNDDDTGNDNSDTGDDNSDDGGGFFSDVIDFGIGFVKGLNPFSSDND